MKTKRKRETKTISVWKEDWETVRGLAYNRKTSIRIVTGLAIKKYAGAKKC